MLTTTLLRASTRSSLLSASSVSHTIRCISTLPSNPHIVRFPLSTSLSILLSVPTTTEYRSLTIRTVRPSPPTHPLNTHPLPPPNQPTVSHSLHRHHHVPPSHALIHNREPALLIPPPRRPHQARRPRPSRARTSHGACILRWLGAWVRGSILPGEAEAGQRA